MKQKLTTYTTIKLTLLLLIACNISKAQIISDFQKDGNGLIMFSEVIKVDSADKNELYLRAKSFFANSFKSGKAALQMEDKEDGILIGKSFKGLCDGEDGISFGCYDMHFSIKITVKDGRYKYEIYDISFRSSPSYPYYPNGIEMAQSALFDSTNYYRSNGEPKSRLEDAKNRVFRQIEFIKQIMFAELNKPSSKKEEW